MGLGAVGGAAGDAQVVPLVRDRPNPKGPYAHAGCRVDPLGT